MVQYLVEKGDDLTDGVPLILACQSGHLDVVRYLVEKGADPNANNNVNTF